MPTYGLVKLPTATKTKACRLGENCLDSGVITPGQVYVQLVRRQYKRSSRSPGTDFGEDMGPGEQGGTKTTVKLWYTNLHLSCFPHWAEYVVARYKEWSSKQPKGRPSKTGALAELSPEEKKHRRSLARRRSYLGTKILKEQNPIVLIDLANEYYIDIPKQLAVPLIATESRQPNEIKQRLTAKLNSVKCPKGTRRYIFCQVDNERLCIRCGKQFACCGQQERVAGNLVCPVHD